jgi:hypothetical protein
MAMAECGANLILTPDQLPHGLTRRATPTAGSPHRLLGILAGWRAGASTCHFGQKGTSGARAKLTICKL